ncbi:MAG TPA: phosphoribosyltransferase family protein, partial [Leptospiraceae bacterium]|nr:phosphoribosyltransferase family protein [Leptospiraceae bacterium]
MQSDFEILISGKQIAEKVREIGAQITRDFQNRELVIIGVLRGCFVFMADLARAIDLPVAIDFMEVSSYGDDLESSGNVKIIKDIKDPIHGKHVLLIEDIIDTGHTLNFVVDHLKLKNPAEMKTLEHFLYL